MRYNGRYATLAATLSVGIGLIAAVSGVGAIPASDRPAASVGNRPEARAAAEVGAESRKDDVQARLEQQFCSRFSETTERLFERMTQAENRLRERYENRESEWEGRWNDRDGRLGGLRTEQDTRREEWYAKLDMLADTEAERDAVKDFRDAVDAAVDGRREAVDVAQQTFRDAIEKLSAERRASFGDGSTAYRAAVEAAVQAANRACEDGGESSEIRTTFRNALQTAKGKIDETRGSGVGDEVTALVEARNEAVKDAADTFHETIDAAKAELEEVLDADLSDGDGTGSEE